MAVSRDVTNLISALMKNHKYSDAETLINEEIAKEPHSVFLLNKLALLYIRTGRYNEAETIIEKSLAVDPASFFSLQAKGDILAAKKEYARAYEIFYDLKREKPRDYYLLKRLSRVCLLWGRMESALEYASEAAAISSEKADIHHTLFQIHSASGDYAAAAHSIERALALEPKNAFYSKEKLSLTVLEKGLNSDDIRNELDLTDKENPEMLKILAKSLKDEKKFLEAAHIYKRLLNSENTDFNRKLYAFANYKAGEYHEAFTQFMLLNDTMFHETIFVNSVTSSARTEEDRKCLLERMIILVKNPAYKRLWPKIKKIESELTIEPENTSEKLM